MTMGRRLRILSVLWIGICTVSGFAYNYAQSKNFGEKTQKKLNTRVIHKASGENFDCSCLKLAPTSKPVITASGYVDIEHCFDTRQIYGFRDGESLVYPLKRDLCACGVDAHKQGAFSMYPFNVRLDLLIQPPPGVAVGNTKKTWACILTDFYGISDSITELLRMREAYVVFEWPESRLLVGQDLHPFFIEDCFPNTVSFSNGAPMEVSTYIPVVRFTQNLNSISGISKKKPIN
ncbi:TPA: hypothetical protein DDZ86_01305 [Candidatus Dependentiae bacterium]|nr:MAG: hypothetical protein UW09_C0004G0142 [candidate division TM6 bacterium GW2011_GWF2_43_87]HBL98263.1 hypothetical protein [Candidatus Dependentiae bacterium]